MAGGMRKAEVKKRRVKEDGEGEECALAVWRKGNGALVVGDRRP